MKVPISTFFGFSIKQIVTFIKKFKKTLFFIYFFNSKKSYIGPTVGRMNNIFTKNVFNGPTVCIFAQQQLFRHVIVWRDSRMKHHPFCTIKIL